ncbi:glutaminyl-tRNA synthetase [Blastomyces silverae]|uniref:Glutaminyl-tRNA synthetase n=1 Tax=Blastomyces silverae TaxID=2060906 RepID=A0A0H1B3N7_9EURO|nr:glutaminyl-tRNA synthetase [Blastomyces silverae]
MAPSTDVPNHSNLKQKGQPKPVRGQLSSNDPDQMFKTGKARWGSWRKPNGYLHIGNSKAIAVNFGFSRFHGGDCYLRFDDTNPKGEEERYTQSIKELVRWLGFNPVCTTYSSDYFDRPYELAEALILKDKAYVCHCTGKTRYACAHRYRTVSETLQEFRTMQEKVVLNRIVTLKEDAGKGV